MKEKELSSRNKSPLWVMLTHDKQRIILNDQEKSAIYSCISSGDKYMIIKGEMFPLHIIPTIRKLEEWYLNEKGRLKMSDKRLCEKCLSVVDIGAFCVRCSERATTPIREYLKITLPILKEKMDEGDYLSATIDSPILLKN